ncbi:ABC transporter substrate-binding protein [Kitasatospora sp. NPDC001175]|uniref:ABC transporter substrate-binding protein n=1 Tax=Kitasatospora sp. NPDC001175 TaxID=3157103 RepID=UPI003D043DB1
MHRRTLPVRIAVVAAVIVASAGCSGNLPTPSASSPVVIGGTVRVATASEIASFDPYSAFGTGTARYAYDSLINVAADGAVVSGLATNWQASATSATFTLRPGVTCSDGTVLKASDVANALTYASDPGRQLAGAQATLPSVPFTATADDPAGTVSVTTAAPYSFLTRTLGLLPIVCPAGLRDPKSLARASSGTGPYVLSGYTPGGPYVFTLREGYAWGPGGATNAAPGQPARIVVSVVPQASTVANLLLTGGVNIATVNGPDRSRLTGRGLGAVEVPTVVGLTFFNERRGRPLGDPALRRALVAALDRAGLANVAAGGTGKAATHFTATDAVCHTDLAAANLPAGDAEQALRSAGWTRTTDGRLAKDGRVLHLRLITSPDVGATLPSVAELMARSWTALGAQVQLVSENLNALVNAMYQEANFDVVVGSTPGFLLPAAFVPFFSGPSPAEGLNFAGIDNPEYSRLVARALQEPDTAGCATWNEAATALFRSADTLPIADGASTVYGYRTTFAVGFGGAVVPTSIRLHG